MGDLTIHAGDFEKGSLGSNAQFDGFLIGGRAKILYTDFESVEVASEDSVQKSGLGAGIAGGVLLGGVGAVAGVLVGRKQKKRVTFVGTLLDGRRMLATCDADVLLRIQGAIFDASGRSVEDRRAEYASRQRQNELLAARKKKRRRVFWAIIIALLVSRIVYVNVTKSDADASPTATSQGG